ncbi:hypothetical protein KFK09_027959 [Dendrobium nobile]|uniref:Uncharacterized protein n=1 Tax=Dendrobium nobile TaxID=94219 RepID=A0A8T3A241_DENNO|nr:hypothetical protein KFK09_027959 [Dendrobium nobile]
MAANALSTATIALTEKKMDMALDDIIKMSKKASFKGKQASRTTNKSQRFMNDRGIQRNSKVQRFMNSRSSIRQGLLSQRRTSFKRNQFPVTTAAARRGAGATIRNRVAYPSKQRFAAASMRRDAGDGNIVRKDKQKPKTLDALFSDLKEQRIRTISLELARSRGQFARQGRRGQRQQRGLYGAANAAAGARAGDGFGKFIR